MRGVIASSIAFCALSGCATIFTGTSQTIAVQTSPAGANCLVSYGGMPIGAVPSTPGLVRVPKSGSALGLTCTKLGYQTAQASQAAGFQPWVVGNIVVGGLLGIGVDFVSGAAYQYEPDMGLTLVPQSASFSALTPEYLPGAGWRDGVAYNAGNPLVRAPSVPGGDPVYRWSPYSTN